MTESSQAYWDELGIEWCAINPDIRVIASRLESRIRRQSRLITAGLVLGWPISVAGLLLGAFSIWSGSTTGALNLVTRGIGILSISAMLVFALSSLMPTRAADAARALPEMIDLIERRGRRALTLINVGLCACALAAVFGLIGTSIRIHLTGPPRQSPIVDLVVLALAALILVLCRRPIRLDLERFRALKRSIEPQETSR